MTRLESLRIFNSFVSTHKLSKAAAEDARQILCLFMPKNACIKYLKVKPPQGLIYEENHKFKIRGADWKDIPAKHDVV